MKNKLESRKDFDTFGKNPILFLQAIKEHALNYQENKYKILIISQALRCLLNCKQKEKESLQDYTKRFRVAAEELESHMGCPIYLLKLMTTMKEFDKNDNDSVSKCGKQKHEQFLAFVYLENADQSKYGSILSGRNTQNSLCNEQYPKTLIEANNVLSNHEFDKKPLASHKRNENKTRENIGEEEAVKLSFAQLEGKCYCYGKAGHRSTTCRYKNKPKSEWAINIARNNENKEEQQHVLISLEEVKEEEEEEQTLQRCWMGAQIVLNQTKQVQTKLKDLI